MPIHRRSLRRSLRRYKGVQSPPPRYTVDVSFN